MAEPLLRNQKTGVRFAVIAPWFDALAGVVGPTRESLESQKVVTPISEG